MTTHTNDTWPDEDKRVKDLIPWELCPEDWYGAFVTAEGKGYFCHDDPREEAVLRFFESDPLTYYPDLNNIYITPIIEAIANKLTSIMAGGWKAGCIKRVCGYRVIFSENEVAFPYCKFEPISRDYIKARMKKRIEAGLIEPDLAKSSFDVHVVDAGNFESIPVELNPSQELSDRAKIAASFMSSMVFCHITTEDLEQSAKTAVKGADLLLKELEK